MKVVSLYFASLVVGCLFSPVASPADDLYRFVSTKYGQVLGVVESEVASFKGVPYATPPKGDLRWQPPFPPQEWSSILVADRYGPACAQPAFPGRVQQPTSEDCLTLNVFTPISNEAKLPVMVWIHGGTFATGVGGDPSFDGSSLASYGVVVVTFNYRLGRIGWFAHPAITKTANGRSFGNYGTLDQIAALQWVKENIGSFGGDPSNITVFGESAGAISVMFLMTSPVARDLFQKAIVQSAMRRGPARNLADEESSGSEFVKSLNSGKDDVETLRRRDPDTIVSGQKPLKKELLAPIGPMIDGQVIVRDISSAFSEHAEMKIPFLIGNDESDASLFSGIRAQPMPGRPSANPGAGAELYPGVADGSQELAAKRFTDQVFTEPARFFAQCHASTGAPTYRYIFGYVARERQQDALAAPHGTELQFLFGDRDLFNGRPLSTVDRKLSEFIMGYWSNFAKTGNPNGKGLPIWPGYKVDREDTLLIRNTGMRIENDLHGRRLDEIHPSGPSTCR